MADSVKVLTSTRLELMVRTSKVGLYDIKCSKGVMYRSTSKPLILSNSGLIKVKNVTADLSENGKFIEVSY